MKAAEAPPKPAVATPPCAARSRAASPARRIVEPVWILLALGDGPCPTTSLRRVTTLAYALRAEVRVLKVVPGRSHVNPLWPPDNLARRVGAIGKVLTACRLLRPRRELDRRNGMPEAQLRVRKGDFVDEVAAYARDMNASLIITPPRQRDFGTHGHSTGPRCAVAGPGGPRSGATQTHRGGDGPRRSGLSGSVSGCRPGKAAGCFDRRGPQRQTDRGVFGRRSYLVDRRCRARWGFLEGPASWSMLQMASPSKPWPSCAVRSIQRRRFWTKGTGETRIWSWSVPAHNHGSSGSYGPGSCRRGQSSAAIGAGDPTG